MSSLLLLVACVVETRWATSYAKVKVCDFLGVTVSLALNNEEELELL